MLISVILLSSYVALNGLHLSPDFFEGVSDFDELYTGDYVSEDWDFTDPTDPSEATEMDDDFTDMYDLEDEDKFNVSLTGKYDENERAELERQQITTAYFNRTDYLWPNGVVPYYLRDSLSDDEKETVKSAMKLLSDKTDGCITFVEFKDKKDHPDWVSFRAETCKTNYIGRQPGGGRQILPIGAYCSYKGEIVHNLMHTLGFWDEQTRWDRDQYVHVNHKYVQDNEMHNFLKYAENSGRFYYGNYDLNSIMQDDGELFRNLQHNDKNIIESLNGSLIVPNFDKTNKQILSEKDIKAVKALYQCKEK